MAKKKAAPKAATYEGKDFTYQQTLRAAVRFNPDVFVSLEYDAATRGISIATVEDGKIYGGTVTLDDVTPEPPSADGKAARLTLNLGNVANNGDTAKITAQ